MVFITGDTHGDWTRLKHPNLRNYTLTSEDTIIVAGDFGIWDASARQRKELNSLARCPYTILFCDGNHENFDMLENDFPIVDFKGGKAHQIRENIFHLMRGEVFSIEEKKYFAFGGARSHDIKDGIYDRATFSSDEEFINAVTQAQTRAGTGLPNTPNCCSLVSLRKQACLVFAPYQRRILSRD